MDCFILTIVHAALDNLESSRRCRAFSSGVRHSSALLWACSHHLRLEQNIMVIPPE